MEITEVMSQLLILFELPYRSGYMETFSAGPEPYGTVHCKHAEPGSNDERNNRYAT